MVDTDVIFTAAVFTFVAATEVVALRIIGYWERRNASRSGRPHSCTDPQFDDARGATHDIASSPESDD